MSYITVNGTKLYTAGEYEFTTDGDISIAITVGNPQDSAAPGMTIILNGTTVAGYGISNAPVQTYNLQTDAETITVTFSEDTWWYWGSIYYAAAITTS